jgi:hypothetical protein
MLTWYGGLLSTTAVISVSFIEMRESEQEKKALPITLKDLTLLTKHPVVIGEKIKV